MRLDIPTAAVSEKVESSHFPIDSGQSEGADAADRVSDGHYRNFPEIDCVRSILPANVLAEAEVRASRLGIGADRVLIASGALTEETYLRRLGEMLGIKFEPLTNVTRALCPITDERLIECARNK
jgi:hypothetical protein